MDTIYKQPWIHLPLYQNPLKAITGMETNFPKINGIKIMKLFLEMHDQPVRKFLTCG